MQGKPQKDSNGKYITNITPAGVTLADGTTYDGSYYNEDRVNEITAAMNDAAKIKEYTDKGATEEDAKAFVARDFAIQTVYGAYSVDSGIAYAPFSLCRTEAALSVVIFASVTVMPF